MKKREAKIQSCFSNETEIHIEKEPDELDLLLETFKLRTHDIPDDNVNSLFGQNKKADRLIVMDDVSGVAEISKKLSNCIKKIWLSLRLCFPCYCSCYTNSAENNFSNKHFQHFSI